MKKCLNRQQSVVHTVGMHLGSNATEKKNPMRFYKNSGSWSLKQKLEPCVRYQNFLYSSWGKSDTLD